MNTHLTPRNGSIHLYDPKKEGLGSYDINYINAHKNKIRTKNKIQFKNNDRQAA